MIVIVYVWFLLYSIVVFDFFVMNGKIDGVVGCIVVLIVDEEGKLVFMLVDIIGEVDFGCGVLDGNLIIVLFIVIVEVNNLGKMISLVN